MGNVGSHAGTNSNDIDKEMIDGVLNSLAYLMQFMANKYKGDFIKIYDYNNKLDHNNRSNIVYKTVTQYIQQPTNPVYNSKTQSAYQEIKKETVNHAKIKKNKFKKWFYLAIATILILFAVDKLLTYHNQTSSSAPSQASRTIHKVHHKKQKTTPLKKKAKASSLKQSSSSNSSTSNSAAPKVNKWVGFYKGENGGDSETLKINEDGSVVFTTNDDNDGVGKATGYWINKGSISSQNIFNSF